MERLLWLSTPFLPCGQRGGARCRLPPMPRLDTRRRFLRRSLAGVAGAVGAGSAPGAQLLATVPFVEEGDFPQIGRASCRERVYGLVYISVVAVSLKKKKKRENSRVWRSACLRVCKHYRSSI